MIVYGFSLSPFVRKVLVVAAEKGVDVEVQPTGSALQQPSKEVLEASPARKMPALRDGDYLLADSSAIIHYLDAKHPERPMIPQVSEDQHPNLAAFLKRILARPSFATLIQKEGELLAKVDVTLK